MKEPTSRSNQGARTLLHPLFLGVALVVTALDLWSKAWAWDFIDRHGDMEGSLTRVYRVIDPWFRLVKAENTGTVWGLFRGFTGVLVVVRVLMILAVVVLAWRTRRDERSKLLGFGLVLGGALGNLHDNLFRDGRAVRDFLDFWIPLPWRDSLWQYPTFNVADACILSGAVLLFIAFSRERPKEPSSASREAGALEKP